MATKVKDRAIEFASIVFPYNAVIDGGCDNTDSEVTSTAVQAAIDAAHSEGRDIIFPAGTYNIEGDRIRIPSDIRVLGDPTNPTIFKRTVDSAQGTIEVYGENNVVISDIQIDYTPSTYTLGYAQCGIQVRNGSFDVQILRCKTTGVINRGIGVINSRDVLVRDCVVVGAGDAGIRVICDLVANAYADFADETSPVQTFRVRVEDTTIHGSTTEGGNTRAGTFYGINISGVASGDLTSNVIVSNCTVRLTNFQGFSTGGRTNSVSFIGCRASGVVDASNTGVGFLVQQYNSNPSQMTTLTGCIATDCYYGFWILSCFYASLSSCLASGCTVAGFYVTATTGLSVSYSTLSACIAQGNLGYGFYVGNLASNIVLSGCQSIANTTVGFATQGTADKVSIVGCSALANTTANYQLNATNSQTAANL